MSLQLSTTTLQGLRRKLAFRKQLAEAGQWVKERSSWWEIETKTFTEGWEIPGPLKMQPGEKKTWWQTYKIKGQQLLLKGQDPRRLMKCGDVVVINYCMKGRKMSLYHICILLNTCEEFMPKWTNFILKATPQPASSCRSTLFILIFEIFLKSTNLFT
jgi:hypothetical protein